MGKRKWNKKNNKKQTTERPVRKDYSDVVKENKLYETYYKEQKCFDLDQFDQVMEFMKKPLPATFRITGYRKDSRQLLQNMKDIYFKNMKNLEIDGNNIETPTALPWYPEDFAWKTNFSRSQLRSLKQLEDFHQFTISETESGFITRQEAVSMIPPLLLDVQSHHKVLDMCAAPGSKTAQLVELLHKDDKEPIPAGICVANDKDNKRCYMLVHQIQRLNSPSSLIVNHDAAHFPEIYIKTKNDKKTVLRYDRVLCDVPCSGDGTLRKNTDIWRLWQPQNAVFLHGLQLRILMRGLQLLAVGGLLVYSTCSINPVEDEAVVAAAIDKCGLENVELVKSGLPGLEYSEGVSSWKVQDKSHKWYENHQDVPEGCSFIPKTIFPPEQVESMNLNRCMRFLPHLQDTGGFFVAVLQKKKLLPWQREVQVSGEEKQDVESKAEDNCSSPKRKRPKWLGGHNEAPFVLFSDKQRPIVDSISSFYQLSEDFPHHQLLTRSHQEKKKRIYFVSDLCKNILENNLDYLKVINTGVRMFSRCDNTHEDIKCDFRLVQDGSECLSKFMKSRIIPVGFDDVRTLLNAEQPEFKTLSSDLRDKLSTIDTGSFMLKFEPKLQVNPVEIDFLMCAWRGKRACRLYLNRHERIHHLNLLRLQIPKHLQLNQNSHRQRQSDEKAAEDQVKITEAAEDQEKITEAAGDQVKITEAAEDQAKITEAAEDQAKITEAAGDQVKITEAASDQSTV